MKQMKLLDKVKGIKKRRDFLILQGLADGIPQVEVASTFHLNKSVVSRIAKRNNNLLNELTLQSELNLKAGRLRLAFNEIRKKIGCPSKKDLLDWLEYVRKETQDMKELPMNKQDSNEEPWLSEKDKALQERIQKALESNRL